MKILSISPIFLISMLLVIITSSIGWTQIINKTMLNIDSAKASIAGPNNIYVTHVRYGDELFSVVLKINQENSATIEKIFNQKHQRLIPDSVDLSQTNLSFSEQHKIQVYNVAVDGIGFSGELEFTSTDKIKLTKIEMTSILPSFEEQITSLQSEISYANYVAKQSQNALQELATASQRARIIPAQINPALLDITNANTSLAGPDSVYISPVIYDKKSYSVLLRYNGVGAATIDAIFSSDNRLIPDSVNLSQTELEVIAPNLLNISNIIVQGTGYSGTLAFTADEEFKLAQLEEVVIPDRMALALQQLNNLEEALELAEKQLAYTLKTALSNLDSDSSVSTLPNGITITLENINFPPNSSDLLDSEKEKLQKIGSILSQMPNRDILVTGHTAHVPNYSGQLLSEERARTASEFLINTGSRTVDTVTYRGVGSRRPVADNITDRGRQRNRRVEFTILRQ